MKYFQKLLLVGLLVFNTTLIYGNPVEKSKESFKEFKSTYGGVVFSVDPRIELYHAVVLGIAVKVMHTH
jgi:hypothetical protein